MKKKIGTVIEEEILIGAKERAARESRPLSELIQESMGLYLQGGGSQEDAERACALFCSNRSRSREPVS